MIVEFTDVAAKGLELRYPYGFETSCDNGTSWLEATAVKTAGNAVFIEAPSCPAPAEPTTVRYCWRTDPCTFKKCPIYSGDLPAPPFIMTMT